MQCISSVNYVKFCLRAVMNKNETHIISPVQVKPFCCIWLFFFSSHSAKPKNSASPVVVQASSAKVVVARCEALQGKPAATITWVTSAMGEYNSTSQPESDGTVTVKSEFRLAPASTDNSREVACVINQHTQDRPQTFPMKLVVQCKICTQSDTHTC